MYLHRCKTSNSKFYSTTISLPIVRSNDVLISSCFYRTMQLHESEAPYKIWHYNSFDWDGLRKIFSFSSSTIPLTGGGGGYRKRTSQLSARKVQALCQDPEKSGHIGNILRIIFLDYNYIFGNFHLEPFPSSDF